MELRLAIGRAGLGLELARPVPLACASVNELSVSLPSARFPLDVSGGVSRFRHRRGALERVEVEVTLGALESFVAPRLRGLLSPETPEVWAAIRADGVTLAIAAPEDVTARAPATRVLVFEIAAYAAREDLTLIVHRARGAALPGPATALALQAAAAIFGEQARRQGARFVIERAASRIARAILPEAGARAPSAGGVVWSALAAQGDAWIAIATRDGVNAAPSESAVRAREAAVLLTAADDARMGGDLDAARALDLAVLERAPRHPDASHRIAEIDAFAGGRAEAALATLREAERGGPQSTDRGHLLGELLVESGDRDGAVAAFVRAGEHEAAPALAAHALERASAITRDADESLELLDRAIARAPRLARLRWTRMQRRLRAGRIEDARADAAHLEALASGSAARQSVWRSAAAIWSQEGLHAEAGALYERALRYAPDSPDALAGLGHALVAEGRAARGVALLARAYERAEALGQPTAAIAIRLARALAESLHDLPAAVARVRSVALEAPEALEARALEGRWRASLGDLGGASLAFAKLRDRVTSRADSERDELALSAFAWLVEAATFERDHRQDLFAAQRHLAAALHLRPTDPGALAAYRDIGRAIANVTQSGRADTTDAPSPLAPPTLAPAAAPAPAPAAALSPEEAESRVAELTQKLQGDPTRDDIAEELIALLRFLGRSHELLALVSARLEDAAPEKRAALLPSARAVLREMESVARADGRESEADLFRDFLSTLA